MLHLLPLPICFLFSVSLFAVFFLLFVFCFGDVKKRNSLSAELLHVPCGITHANRRRPRTVHKRRRFRVKVQKN